MELNVDATMLNPRFPGSMLYYSPEIISGQKYYGPEVDCWCLGIALFRMTVGYEPFAHAHSEFIFFYFQFVLFSLTWFYFSFL